MLGHCGSHPWGQLPYSPRGMTAGRCANAPAGGGLTGGWVCPTPPGGIQKGRPVVFSWRQSASRTFSPSIALPTRIRQPILSVGTVGRFALRPTYPGQGVDDSWAHGLMRQLGQHLGQGSCCPARWFRPFVLVTWLLFCAWVNKGRVPVEPCSVALPKDHLCPIGVAPHTIGQV